MTMAAGCYGVSIVRGIPQFQKVQMIAFKYWNRMNGIFRKRTSTATTRL
uniref:Uncharacterized protein n=1 Tax=Rhizophora mucronata TaxID=61149 RepID=A0A2P2KUU3_RHIMU